jgi:hypothetical protein
VLFFASVLSIVAALSVALSRGDVASAQQVVHVQQDGLDELQDGCLDRGAFGVKSWEFRLTEDEDVVPDLTVTIDTNGDDVVDREATVAANNEIRPQPTYRLSGQGLVIDAFASFPDDWEGQLTLSSVRCDFGAPPADACAEFPDRTVFHLNQRIGDPKAGLPSQLDIPQNQVGPGAFNVTLKSADAHSEHGGQGQEHESWYVGFPVHLSFVQTDPIGDLPDNQDAMNQKVGQVRLVSDPSHIVIIHDRWSGGGDFFETPESVTVLCVALDRVGNATYIPGFPDYVPPNLYYIPQRLLD